MSFYTRAFNDLDDPFWACQYNEKSHPLYRKCDQCPSFDKCTLRPQLDYSPQCSCLCIECAQLGYCPDIREFLAAQVQLEKNGKEFKRWKRWCLNPRRNSCYGCDEALYCPKLAQRMNRPLPPEPSFFQRLCAFFKLFKR